MRFSELLALGGLVALFSIGCSKGPSLPDQPNNEPATRTTTLLTTPTPAELARKIGLPTYPGANAPDGMSRMPHRDSDGMHYELVLLTRDNPKRVSSFYARLLKSPPTVNTSGTMIVGLTPNGNSAIVTIASEGGQTLIRLKGIGK